MSFASVVLKTKSAGISIPPCGRSNENLPKDVDLFTIRTIIRGKFDFYRTKLEKNPKLVNMDPYCN